MLKKYWFAGLVIGILLAGLIAGCESLVGPTETTTLPPPTTTAAGTTTTTSGGTTTTAGGTTTTTTSTTTTMVLTKAFYPNADGNVWIYKCLTFDGGSTTESTAEVTFNGTQTVEGQTAQIQTCYDILPDGTLVTNEAFGSVLIIATNADVKEYGAPDNPIMEANVHLLFPSVVGDSWPYGWFTEGAHILITTEALAVESVTVPAGTFNCFRVGISAPHPPDQPYMAQINWYAKDVGLVKRLVCGIDPLTGAFLFSLTLELKSKNF